MLARFMAVPHYTYLVLKMPAPKGVLTIYCDLLTSFKCDSETLDHHDERLLRCLSRHGG
jgi:hypothetical protein